MSIDGNPQYGHHHLNYPQMAFVQSNKWTFRAIHNMLFNMRCQRNVFGHKINIQLDVTRHKYICTIYFTTNTIKAYFLFYHAHTHTHSHSHPYIFTRIRTIAMIWARGSNHIYSVLVSGMSKDKNTHKKVLHASAFMKEISMYTNPHAAIKYPFNTYAIFILIWIISFHFNFFLAAVRFLCSPAIYFHIHLYFMLFYLFFSHHFVYCIFYLFSCNITLVMLNICCIVLYECFSVVVSKSTCLEKKTTTL